MHQHNKEVAMNRIGRDRASAVDAFAAIVVVLILIAGVMAVLLYTHMSTPAHVSPGIVMVEEGDEVGFIYTGYLENTLIFETLDIDVASDNVTYKKSLLYQWPEDGVFDPIVFVVGDGIGEDEFQGMANNGRVLEEAMIDAQQNETIFVDVTPETGFGDPDPTLIKTLSLTETMDQKQILTFEEFGNRFDSQVIANATYLDPIWGWDVRITHIDESGKDRTVTIINLPDEGGIYTPYVGFQSQVVSIESGVNEGKGEIEMVHLLDPADANKVMGISPHGDGIFMVVGVNSAAGTFQADFNSEKTGAFLRYEITIVSILKR